MDALVSTLQDNDLVVAFALVGLVTAIAMLISKVLTRGKFQVLGDRHHHRARPRLYRRSRHRRRGRASRPVPLPGIGLMGGRDAGQPGHRGPEGLGASFEEMKKSGLGGIISLVLGVVLSFAIGVVIALMFGYSDPVDLATIGAGTATYIVGPVYRGRPGREQRNHRPERRGRPGEVGPDNGADSIRGQIHRSEQSAFGHRLRRAARDHERVTAGLAATDKRLVPYGAMTSRALALRPWAAAWPRRCSSSPSARSSASGGAVCGKAPSAGGQGRMLRPR